MEKYKILLGQLERGGDCLYATAIARQIKQDYPNCRLTWAIHSSYRSIIDNNPYVDDVWEIKPEETSSPAETWERFQQEAIQRKKLGIFDEIFFTQIAPANFQNYDGTCRSSLFRNYPHRITVPIQPTIRLFDNEKRHVADFIKKNHILSDDFIILYECASTSGQSYVTPDFAIQTAKRVVRQNRRIKFILSSNKKILEQTPNIIDGSSLSFRENAELTHYCHLILGCSSGISWLATSDWAKPLPQIQLLSQSTGVYASMLNDAKFFHLPTDHILEIADATPNQVSEIVASCVQQGFAVTKKKYQRKIPLSFNFYFTQIDYKLLSKNLHVQAAHAIRTALYRYQYDEQGTKELQRIIKKIFGWYVKCHWAYLNEKEKKAFVEIGVEPRWFPNRFITRIVCMSLLLFYSLYGNNKRIARRFFLTTLRHLRQVTDENSSI